MILLCDLDGTLLANSMDSFQPSYLKALGKYLSGTIQPEKMIAELLVGTRKMIENKDPLVTLEMAFDAHFYPSLGFEKSELNELIMSFYQEVFPTLGYLTAQIPDAINFVHSRISTGDRVVIATNPLFPRKATLARLAWAGLPIDSTNFELVTTYEFMHFSKPHAAYFAEILAYLGYPLEETVMIGNDLNEDILAAKKLNLPVFWLTIADDLSGHNESSIPSGTFSELNDFLSKDFRPIDIYHTENISSLAAILKATLAALNTYCLYSNAQNDGAKREMLSLIIATRLSDDQAIFSKINSVTTPNNNTDNSMDPMVILKKFARYRLGYLEQIQHQSDSFNANTLTELRPVFWKCIEHDRKMMLECKSAIKYVQSS